MINDELWERARRWARGKVPTVACCAAVVVCGAAACSDDAGDASEPDISSPDGGYDSGPDATDASPRVIDALNLTPLFPTPAQPSVVWDDCMFASPQVYTDAGGQTSVVVAVSDQVAALDPDTGAQRWSVELPAPDGERAMVLATPARAGRRLVVAYHTTAQGAGRNAGDARLRQRVAVVDLDAKALDAGFEVLELAATVPAVEQGQTVTFRPQNALARAALVHVSLPGDALGRVIVTFGNARDIQPWHGWAFQLSLDAWASGGASEAVASVLLTTPEHDCGPDGLSGSRERICGGGLWAPSGPLVIERDGAPELILAPGNGQFDLLRGDYANTLMRVGPELGFDPMCDADLCAGFDPNAPDDACAASCARLFIPRLSPGEPPLNPESGACDGLGFFDCWAALDYIGGSTPVEVPLRDGRRVLVYPTKEGTVFMVDADHLGRMYDREAIVSICGTKEDPCVWDWAGMIVTQPVVAEVGGEHVVVIPTFMPDATHPAGVVALRVVEAGGGGDPQLEPLWTYPDFASAEAVARFRRHPSRPVLGTYGPDGAPVVWVVEMTAGQRATAIALDVASGARLGEHALVGNGMRFAQPLLHEGALYAPSCATDNGPGTLEGHRIEEVEASE